MRTPNLSVIALLVIVAPALVAQGRFTADTDVRAAPDGNVVAMLRSGTTWATGVVRSGFTEVTIVGWVESSRFTTGRDSFPQTIGGTDILRIRAEPSLRGEILGEFRPGAGLRILERRGNWARIRRSAWAPSARIVSAATVAAPTPAATPTTTPATTAGTPAPMSAPAGAEGEASGPRPPARGGALRVGARASMHAGPGGTPIADLVPDAIAVPLARERGWVKVRVEGWVAESLLVPADTAFGATLSAADLRLDPQGTRGRVVRWSVQVVGLQTADPLRRDMAVDEPFLLAMGPEGEDAILYIAVPQALLAEARAIAPLSRVTLTARVRTGRSDPTGAPILDLISIVGR